MISKKYQIDKLVALPNQRDWEEWSDGENNREIGQESPPCLYLYKGDGRWRFLFILLVGLTITNECLQIIARS
jgi:hypothetical protein